VAMEGAPESILADHALQAAYLGRAGATEQRGDGRPTISVS